MHSSAARVGCPLAPLPVMGSQIRGSEVSGGGCDGLEKGSGMDVEGCLVG